MLESFGNNGNRFGSFEECSHDEQGLRKYFPGGVHLKFSAKILDDNQSSATGFWQLFFHTYGTTNAITKNGTFYSGQVLGGGNEDASRGVTFTLGGIDITEEICGGISKSVIIKASCSEAAPVFYSELDGDNSTLYNMGDVLQCTAIPERGYIFDSWTGIANDLSSNPLTVEVSEFGTLTANFKPALSPEVYIFMLGGIVGASSIFLGWYYKYGQRRYTKKYLTRIETTYETLRNEDNEQCIMQLQNIRRELLRKVHYLILITIFLIRKLWII